MNREAELTAPTGVGSGASHEKAVKWNFVGTWFFYSEWAALARPERIALPSELAGESGSWLDPMSFHCIIWHFTWRMARRVDGNARFTTESDCSGGARRPPGLSHDTR